MRRRWIRDLRPDDKGPQLAPSCEPGTIAAAEADIGASATAWAVQIAAVATQTALASGRPDVAASAVFTPMRRACESCVLTILRGLHADTPADRIEEPVEMLPSVRDAVHAGVPLERLLRAMWNAHTTTMDALIPAIEESVDSTSRTAQSRAVSRLSFGYVNTFGDWISEEYSAEREAWVGSVASAKRDMIAAVVADRPIDVAAAERLLGIRFTDHHLALVVWTRADVPGPLSDRDLLDVAAAAAKASGASSTVSVHGPPSSVWAWLSWPAAPAPGTVRVLAGLGVAPQVRAAAGPVSSGLGGFRRSHLGALQAQRFCALSPAWLSDYRDVAVVSLLTTEREQSGWYATETLGRLADGEGRALRETLRVYLSCGRSRAKAAQRLHVAPGTVAYRVKRAEQLLARELDGHEQEILVALEILRGLDSARP